MSLHRSDIRMDIRLSVSLDASPSSFYWFYKVVFMGGEIATLNLRVGIDNRNDANDAFDAIEKFEVFDVEPQFDRDFEELEYPKTANWFNLIKNNDTFAGIYCGRYQSESHIQPLGDHEYSFQIQYSRWRNPKLYVDEMQDIIEHFKDIKKAIDFEGLENIGPYFDAART